MQVSAGGYMGGENINPIMLRLVDLILRNCERRDRRPDPTVFVVARSTPMARGGWWWDTVESLVKIRREYRLCVYVVSAEPQGVRASYQPASKHRYSTSSHMRLRDRRLNLAIRQIFWD